MPSIKIGWYVRIFRMLCIIAIILQAMSCMPVIKIIYGIHNPRYQSDDKVFKFTQHLKLDGYIYRLHGYNEESRRNYRYLGNTMPDVLIFNTQGLLTHFEVNCTLKWDSIVSLTPHLIDQMPVGDKTINDFINDSYILPNNELSINLIEPKRPIYALKFAEFAGRLNKNNFPKLVAKLQERDDVDYILLNMDYTIKK